MKHLYAPVLLLVVMVNATVASTTCQQVNEFSFILKSSGSIGIGVFATHAITQGTFIRFLPVDYQPRIMQGKDIPADFIKYCVAVNDDEWRCPNEFDCMELVWYLNHSDVPNLRRIGPGYYVVIADIAQGQEVTMDYNELDEPEHLKEEYYRRKIIVD